ncbi:unnamed protein product, partial [Staurois parvus]
RGTDSKTNVRRVLTLAYAIQKNIKRLNPLHCAKMLFDPVFFNPPLLLVSPFYLLIRHFVWRHSAHAQFGVYC